MSTMQVNLKSVSCLRSLHEQPREEIFFQYSKTVIQDTSHVTLNGQAKITGKWWAIQWIMEQCRGLTHTTLTNIFITDQRTQNTKHFPLERKRKKISLWWEESPPRSIFKAGVRLAEAVWTAVSFTWIPLGCAPKVTLLLGRPAATGWAARCQVKVEDISPRRNFLDGHSTPWTPTGRAEILPSSTSPCPITFSVFLSWLVHPNQTFVTWLHLRVGFFLGNTPVTLFMTVT